jgi:hypothetical protein
VRGGVPRRFGRLAGAAWRQPALDAARRARRGRGWGGHGGRVRRRAAESRHCVSRGGKLADTLGMGENFGEECWMWMAGNGDGWGRKGRAGAGRGAIARRAPKGFRLRAGTREHGRALASGTGVSGSSKTVCARAFFVTGETSRAIGNFAIIIYRFR